MSAERGTGHDGNLCGHHPEWCDNAGTCRHPDPLHEIASCEAGWCNACEMQT